MIYICNDCGNLFDEDDFETLGRCDCRGYRCGGLCNCRQVTPCCNSENYQEAKCCENCGDYFDPKDERDFCEECLAPKPKGGKDATNSNRQAKSKTAEHTRETTNNR